MSSINEDTPIKLSRSRYIERDRSIAILRLDEHYFYVGEPVIVRYYVDPETQEEIDTLIAVGIQEGLGKECYQVVSLGGLVLVRDVVDELPDVSQLVHGELYLYHNPDDSLWYYVYKPESSNERQIEQIKAPDTVFVNIETRYRWFWKDGVLKREDDFYSRTEVDDIINELVNLVSPPTLTASIQEGTLFESGTSQTITLEIHVLNSMDVDVTKTCKIFIDDQEVVLNRINCIQFSNQQANRDFVIKAEYNVGSIKRTLETVVKLRFGYYFYYGIVDQDWVPSSPEVRNLGNSVLSVRQNFIWNDITLEKQKTVFAYPKVYGLMSHIYDDNGLCYIPDYLVYEIELPGEEVYYVYVKKDIVQIENFNQHFIFAVEDTTDEIRFGKLGEVIRAWERQNMKNGLVVLDPTGTIPETLIPSSNFSSGFIELKGFVTSYPQYGMSYGDRYFNITTKKIFVATSDTAGKIEDPKEERLYLNLSDQALYIWKTPEMISVGGEISSSKITSILEIL